MTGILENDVTPKKPTADQTAAIKNDLDDRCASFSGRASIDQPGLI